MKSRGERVDYTVTHNDTLGDAMTTNMTRDLPYGLLDQETGNFVGFFQTQAAALAVVADSLDRYGKDGVDSLALAFAAGR
jgi:hypothetical protein